MKIDENEKIKIWLAGNTGLRNPMRIQEGFIAFSQSPYVGNLHGNENERGFTTFLNEKGIIDNKEGKDPSGSHARKWRLMFERYGFIYGQAESKNGFKQEELGKIDDITPFGRVFMKADTVPAMQECFLRSLSIEQEWLPQMALVTFPHFGGYLRSCWNLKSELVHLSFLVSNLDSGGTPQIQAMISMT